MLASPAGGRQAFDGFLCCHSARVIPMTWFLLSAVLKNLPLHSECAFSFSPAYHRLFHSCLGGVQTLTSLVPFFAVILNRITVLGFLFPFLFSFCVFFFPQTPLKLVRSLFLSVTACCCEQRCSSHTQNEILVCDSDQELSCHLSSISFSFCPQCAFIHGNPLHSHSESV